MSNLKCWMFYSLLGKYPRCLGYAYGKTKQDAFETLKLINGFREGLKLGRKIKGYILK